MPAGRWQTGHLPLHESADPSGTGDKDGIHGQTDGGQVHVDDEMTENQSPT